jgi:hypothetical protein
VINDNVVAINQPSETLNVSAGTIDTLERELHWCDQVIEARFKLYFQTQDCSLTGILEVPPPSVTTLDYYGEFIIQTDAGFLQRLTLILALVPVIKPKLLDALLSQNEATNRIFSEFGSILKEDGGVFASGETLAFIMGGDDLTERFKVQAFLEENPKKGVQQALDMGGSATMMMKNALQLKPEYLQRFTSNKPYEPQLNADFPARRVKSQLSWSDLVLAKALREQLEEIQGWVTHSDTLMKDWGMGDRMRPGYRALFYGPPGTGKTLTACVLGNAMGRPVYKVDLSLIVSKYIGETEKNLEKVFLQAEDKSWILFFDEADALFGKRSETTSANDQFANQNVSYLLQRIESFNGIIILASNYKDNFDKAFFRRFESMIYFPIPLKEERLELWKKGFSEKCSLEPCINLDDIADQYSLGGADIINVIQYASLKALCREQTIILNCDISEGIRRVQSTNDPNYAITGGDHLGNFR